MGLIVVFLLVGGISFFAGYKTATASQSAQKLSENTQGGQPRGGGRPGAGGRNGAGFNGGEVLSKDDQSIVIKSRDGGSKIVFYSPSTEISKFVTGLSSDISIGEMINVTGDTNADGSVTAKTIQIRPAQIPAQGGAPSSSTK